MSGPGGLEAGEGIAEVFEDFQRKLPELVKLMLERALREAIGPCAGDTSPAEQANFSERGEYEYLRERGLSVSLEEYTAARRAL